MFEIYAHRHGSPGVITLTSFDANGATVQNGYYKWQRGSKAYVKTHVPAAGWRVPNVYDLVRSRSVGVIRAVDYVAVMAWGLDRVQRCPRTPDTYTCSGVGVDDHRACKAFFCILRMCVRPTASSYVLFLRPQNANPSSRCLEPLRIARTAVIHCTSYARRTAPRIRSASGIWRGICQTRGTTCTTALTSDHLRTPLLLPVKASPVCGGLPEVDFVVGRGFAVALGCCWRHLAGE